MKSTISSQHIFVSLLAASYFISSSAVWALASQSQSDSTETGNQKSTPPRLDRKRSIALTPKWSLPFQGQLDVVPAVPNKSVISAQNKSVTSAQNKEITAKASAAVNSLTMFKPKKYQVLTLKPQETLDNSLIAEASTPSNTGVPIQKVGKLIAGEISVWDGPFNVERIVNHLLETHFENSPEGQKLDKQVKVHSGLGHKTIAVTKDSLQYVMEYQGIGPSTRAGKLILDSPDVKIRNKAWADFARQKYIDKIHGQVVACLMQISEGIGNSESEHGKQAIAAGKTELGALVGEEEAERAVKALTLWLNNTNVPYAAFAQAPWNTIERTKKLEAVLSAAVAHDPVIVAVTARLYKYANPGNLALRSSQVVQPTLNLVSLLTPGYMGTAIAEPMLVAYKMGTGGSEENKMERELLFDKRIQSRLKVLNQEASLALDNYRYALITKNPPLLAFSQEVVENLTGSPNSLNPPIGHDPDITNTFVPELKDSEPEQAHEPGKLNTVKYIVKKTSNILN